MVVVVEVVEAVMVVMAIKVIKVVAKEFSCEIIIFKKFFLYLDLLIYGKVHSCSSSVVVVYFFWIKEIKIGHNVHRGAHNKTIFDNFIFF